MENLTGKKEKLTQVIKPVIKDNFMELVDIEVDKGKNIRIRIDRPGSGVTVDDCSLISKKINEIEGLEDIVQGNYSLEVSSPGINRPLKSPDDFDKFRGRKIKVVLKKPEAKETVHKGHIRDANENEIILDKGIREVKIRRDNIKKARLDEDII